MIKNEANIIFFELIPKSRLTQKAGWHPTKLPDISHLKLSKPYEKSDYDQRLEFGAPKCWSKCTTSKHPSWVFHTQEWFEYHLWLKLEFTPSSNFIINTYSKAKATRAQVTTIPSRIFHPSLKYDPGCKIMPKSRIYKSKIKQNNIKIHAITRHKHILSSLFQG